MSDYASNDEKIREDVTHNNERTDHSYAVRLYIIITGFFT
jgi:hypothetical protein